jgi:iron complex transport system ATP-binding protein
MISVNNLTLSVPGRVLISDLQWEIEAGQRWCVLGKNGSGKSTLLKTIAGLQPLETTLGGQINWNQKEIHQISHLDLARLRAYAEQTPQAANDWKAIDVVEAGASPWKVIREVAAISHVAYREELAALVKQAMKRCDVSHLEQQLWKYLSGGERQRVALASCLVQSTSVLILDEPTAHLDLGHQFNLMDDLVEASQSCQQSIIASLHDLQIAMRSFTHALILNGDEKGTWIAGEINEVLTPENIDRALGHPVTWATTESGLKVLVPQ